MKDEKENDWHLDKLELEFQRWGEDKGKYSGRITFKNGQYESFTFKVRPEMANDYIKQIAVDLVLSADSLASRLKDSLTSQGLINED